VTEPTSPQHIPYRRGTLRGRCLAGYESFDLSAIPWDRLGSQSHDGIDLAKRSRTRRVVRMEFAPDGEAPRGVYAKRVQVLDNRKRIGALLIPSKARHEWNAGYRLIEMGVATARPVVFAEEWRGPWLAASFLVTEELVGARSLREELARVDDRRGRRNLLAEFGCWLWSVHRRGFYHDDCSAEHVYVRTEKDAEKETPAEKESSGRKTAAVSEAFLFIDLDNCRFHRRAVPWWRRVKNLFQVLRSIPTELASRTDRLHFVLSYLEASGERRRLHRAVAGMRRLARRKDAQLEL
jgi:hypothetical protein